MDLNHAVAGPEVAAERLVVEEWNLCVGEKLECAAVSVVQEGGSTETVNQQGITAFGCRLEAMEDLKAR